jgi:8-oxo-dGTP diphosphatase
MSSVPPPLDPNRDPGDAWVEAADGVRYWGRFGAAGLLVVDQHGRVLLQHRALWSHHGGTWGIPGGARHEGEGALAAALREAAEEAGVPADAVVPFATTILDRDVWTYTTVVARATREFTPVAGDAESLELSWVPIDEVSALALHPAFERAWPGLLGIIGSEFDSRPPE